MTEERLKDAEEVIDQYRLGIQEGDGALGKYNDKYRPELKETEHRCGLTGYNPMLGDSCPACEEEGSIHKHRG